MPKFIRSRQPVAGRGAESQKSVFVLVVSPHARAWSLLFQYAVEIDQCVDPLLYVT
jgi:hypothetical protein